MPNRFRHMLWPALGVWLGMAPLSLAAQEHSAHPISYRPPPVVGAHQALHAASADRSLAAERLAIRTAIRRRSRWREGAIVGAVVFGAAGVVVGGGLCGADDSAAGSANDGCTGEMIGGGLIGVVVGGVAGAVVGSQIHKGPPDVD
jgi:hypothetical protein